MARGLLSIEELRNCDEPWTLVAPQLWLRWGASLEASGLLDNEIEVLAPMVGMAAPMPIRGKLGALIEAFPFQNAPPPVAAFSVLLVAALVERRLNLGPSLVAESEREALLSGAPLSIAERHWPAWTSFLLSEDIDQYTIIELLEGVAMSWPSNRRTETLRPYLDLTLRQILGLRNIGRKKCRAIVIAVVEAVRLFESRQRPDADEAEKAKAPELLEDVVNEFVLSLKERQQEIMRRRFGFGGKEQETLEEIAQELSLTRERVRQIEKKTLASAHGRPHFLQSLRNAIKADTDDIWNSLSKNSDTLTCLSSKGEYSKRLRPEQCLGLKILGIDPETWLDENGHRFEGGWHRYPIGPHLLKRLAHELKHNQGLLFPTDVETLAHQLECQASAVRLAAALVGDVHLYQGYVWRGRLGRRGRRTIWLHRILASETENTSTSTHHLVARHNQIRPNQPTGYRDAELVMSRYPHLFQDMGSGHWSAMEGKPLLGVASQEDEEPEQESDDTADGSDETVAGRLRHILEANGPLFVSKLMQIVSESEDFAPTSTAPILLTTGHFDRLAPGLYGVRNCLASFSSDEVLNVRKMLLAETSCEKYIRSRYAGEDRALYPLWDPEMEKMWCEWGEHELGADCFESLLVISDIDTWPCSDEDKERWHGRRQDAVYQLDATVDGKKIDKLVPNDLVAPVVFCSKADSFGWVSVNRLYSRRLNDSRAKAVLGLLILAGVVRPQDDWRAAHQIGDNADDVASLLRHEQHLKGRQIWTSPGIEYLVALVREGASHEYTGWLDREQIDEILALLPESVETVNKTRVALPAEAMVQLSIAIALADGQLHPDEEEGIKKYAERRLDELPVGERTPVVSLIQKSKEQAVDAEKLARRLAAALSKQERRDFLSHLFEIALADGVYCEEEASVLRSVQRTLGIDPDYFEALHRQARRLGEDSSTIDGEEIQVASEESSPTLDDLVSLVTLV